MGNRIIKLPHYKTTTIYIIICLLTSIIFALTVSLHDYQPVHPPAYLLLAEDKLKPHYATGRILKGKGDIEATCDSTQASSDVPASVSCLIIAGNYQHFKGFLSLATDLSPPAA